MILVGFAIGVLATWFVMYLWVLDLKEIGNHWRRLHRITDDERIKLVDRLIQLRLEQVNSDGDVDARNGRDEPLRGETEHL